jgi:hypothetical protein
MAERSERFALLSRYSKHYAEKYNVKPEMNLHKAQHASGDLVDSFTLPVCYDILEYYFQVAESPSWTYFVFNAEKILQAKKDKLKDDEDRAERRRMAKEWLSE